MMGGQRCWGSVGGGNDGWKREQGRLYLRGSSDEIKGVWRGFDSHMYDGTCGVSDESGMSILVRFWEAF